MITKLTFADTETINLNVSGDKMPVDSFGYVSISVEDNDWRVCTPMLLRILTSTPVLDEIKSRSQKSIAEPCTWTHDGIGVEVWQQNVDVLDQLGSGRIFSADTWNWHKKNGYAIDKVERANLKSVISFLADRLSNSDTIFYRGTDFDVPIWTSIFKDNGKRLPVKYNLVRDMRTAIDELLFTDKPLGALLLDKYKFVLRAFSPYDRTKDTDVDADLSLSPVLDSMTEVSMSELFSEMDTYIKVFEDLKHLRHTALVDSYLDCLSYVMLKHYRNYNVAVVPVKL